MSRAEVASSKFVCQKLCPVQRECLKAALSGEEAWGVWGGYSAPERHRAFVRYGTVKAIMVAFDNDSLSAEVVRRGER